MKGYPVGHNISCLKSIAYYWLIWSSGSSICLTIALVTSQHFIFHSAFNHLGHIHTSSLLRKSVIPLHTQVWDIRQRSCIPNTGTWYSYISQLLAYVFSSLQYTVCSYSAVLSAIYLSSRLFHTKIVPVYMYLCVSCLEWNKDCLKHNIILLFKCGFFTTVEKRNNTKTEPCNIILNFLHPFRSKWVALSRQVVAFCQSIRN